MIIHAQLLLLLLTTVTWTEGKKPKIRGPLIPYTRAMGYPVTESTFNKPSRTPFWSSRRIRTTSTATPTTTAEVLTMPNPSIPSSPSSFFTTDSLSFKTLTMPLNGTNSRLLYWPPSQNISVTLNVSLFNQRDFTLSLGIVLAQHWHTVDLYPMNKFRNSTELHLYTDKYTAVSLERSPIFQMHVSSEETIYWCFCPQANLCTLLSPLDVKYPPASSSASTDLLVPLIVVVLLFVVTLFVLIGVTFYRRSELFHIYAKPVDCLPHALPPPLPSPNHHPSPRQIKNEKNQREADKKEESTDHNNEYNEKASPNTLIIPGYSNPTKDLKKDTMNTLYGLV